MRKSYPCKVIRRMLGVGGFSPIHQGTQSMKTRMKGNSPRKESKGKSKRKPAK
jgi:hypothetical protein